MSVDPVVVVIGLIMLAVGLVVGAKWPRSGARRNRPGLPLPDERPRRAAGGRP